MENNQFGQFDTFSKAALESAKELETINGKVIEQLAQKNMDLFNSVIEMNNKFVSMFGEAKGVQELVTEQIKLTSEYNGKVIATMKEAAEIMVGSKDVYQSWFEGGLKNATESAQTFTPAAKAPKKKAA